MTDSLIYPHISYIGNLKQDNSWFNVIKWQILKGNLLVIPNNSIIHGIRAIRCECFLKQSRSNAHFVKCKWSFSWPISAGLIMMDLCPGGASSNRLLKTRSSTMLPRCQKVSDTCELLCLISAIDLPCIKAIYIYIYQLLRSGFELKPLNIKMKWVHLAHMPSMFRV